MMFPDGQEKDELCPVTGYKLSSVRSFDRESGHVRGRQEDCAEVGGRGNPSMNAVSIQQPDAAALLSEQEPVSYAGWQTSHRGPLLIHAAKRHTGKDLTHQAPGLVYNAVIGVVDLSDCVREDHL